MVVYNKGMYKSTKPLGRKAYGSIGHLPNSRLGPGDHAVTEGQARICELKPRDKHDRIIVQEKLDGSNCSVVLLDGQILALGRAGYLAQSSKYEMHQLFADWVRKNEDRFRAVLKEGERICGEWLAQAHGTLYDLTEFEPYAVFDIMVEDRRLSYDEFNKRVGNTFMRPTLLHDGLPIPVEQALKLHKNKHWPCDEIEGVVYRVERRGQIDFLAKYVRADKIDGKYLGGDPIWLWRPDRESRK